MQGLLSVCITTQRERRLQEDSIQHLVFVCVLTGHPSEVNRLFGTCGAAPSEADAVLTGCVDMELQDVVLGHHWRHRHRDTITSALQWCRNSSLLPSAHL